MACRRRPERYPVSGRNPSRRGSSRRARGRNRRRCRCPGPGGDCTRQRHAVVRPQIVTGDQARGVTHELAADGNELGGRGALSGPCPRPGIRCGRADRARIVEQPGTGRRSRTCAPSEPACVGSLAASHPVVAAATLPVGPTPYALQQHVRQIICATRACTVRGGSARAAPPTPRRPAVAPPEPRAPPRPPRRR